MIYDPLDKHISTGEPIQPFVPEHRASSSVCTSRKRYSELNWFSEKKLIPCTPYGSRICAAIGFEVGSVGDFFEENAKFSSASFTLPQANRPILTGEY